MNKKEMNLQQGMAWYKFLIYFGLFAGAIINYIDGMFFITGDIYVVKSNGDYSSMQMYHIYGDGLKAVDILFGLCLFIMAVLTLILRYKLKYFIRDAYDWVIIVYASGVGMCILYLLMIRTICNITPTLNDLIAILEQLIALIINAVYFKKRSHLFVNQSFRMSHIKKGMDKIDTERGVSEGSGARQIKFCQYCGASVAPNSRFCQSCGEKLVHDKIDYNDES